MSVYWRNMSLHRILFLVPISIALTACGANFNSIYRDTELGSSDRLVSTDAKQRVILRQKRGKDGALVTCFEPSPDAFSVFAATASGNVDVVDKVTAALSGTSAESGANIGLRTQTITVLRDQGFRACEAYANEGIHPEDYQQLLRRNQILSTATLAIEQLTGAVVGASAAVAAGGSLEIDQDAVASATGKVAEAADAVKVAEGALTNSKSKRDTQQKIVKEKQEEVTLAEAGLTEKKDLPADNQERIQAEAKLENANTALTEEIGKLTPLEEDVVSKQAVLDGKKEALQVYEQALRSAQTPNQESKTATSTTGAEVRAAIPGVANAVQNIVELAFTKTHLIEFCQTLWSGTIDDAPDEATDICNRVLTQFEHTIAHETHAKFGRDIPLDNAQATQNTSRQTGDQGGSLGRVFGSPQLH